MQSLNDVERAFQQTCRRFTKERIEPFAHAWEEAESFPRELYAEAAQIGLLAAGFPEDCGGTGQGGILPLLAVEVMLWGGSTGVVAGLSSHGIALPPIINLGTADQRQRWVPPVLRGEKIAALGITEPGTGSDVAGIRTKAVRDGDAYVVNGAKMFITSGCRADFVSVLARTSDDPHGGLTFFVVERDMPGFSVSRSLKKTGWRASDTAELSFQDVRVPMSHRLGDEGSGFIALMQNFQAERLALAFMGHATAEVALHDALAYARERQAFGRSLGKFQVIKHKLAEMATRTQAARTFNHDVARECERGEIDVARVSMAKNFAADVANEVCYQAVQILGGAGYMRESRVERLSRDARLLPIGGGTTEIMNELIARWGLGL